MNTDQIKGKAKDIAGQAQRKLGEVTGSTSQQVKGAKTEAEGKTQKAYGDVKDAVKKANE